MEEIPADAPFIYADPEKKKKFVLIGTDFKVDAAEYERIRKWFELQFFVSGEGRTSTLPTQSIPADPTSHVPSATHPDHHVPQEPVLIKVPPKEEVPMRPVPDSE